MKTTVETFATWADWFRDFQSRQLKIDWDSMTRVPQTIHPTVKASVRQFQLGESSEARNLKAKVARFVKRGGDRAYQDAMEWFIFEENRHSRLLGRFMALENMPKAHHQFTDHLFRLARHAVGLRHSITILMSAELVAIPYYSALRDATPSPVLTVISQQILHDENMHIRFQAKAIRMLLQGKSILRRKIAYHTAKCMLEFALRVLWLNHASLLRLGGYRFQDLRKESHQHFQWAWDMIEAREPNPDPKHVHALPHKPTRAMSTQATG